MSYHLLVTRFGLAPTEILILTLIFNIFIYFCQVKITKNRNSSVSGKIGSGWSPLRNLEKRIIRERGIGGCC